MATDQRAGREAQLAYVRDLLDKLGTDATNLARRAKINPSTLTRFMTASGKQAALRRSTLEALAQAAKMPLPADLADPGPFTASPSIPAAFPTDVPIHALLSAPVEAAFFWNQTAFDYAPRPPGIAQASRTFAFRMPDDTMDGWRRVNEMIYVDPMRAVAEGDHALVEMANTIDPNQHSIYVVRRVVRRRPDGVVLGTWGLNPTEQRYDRKEILSFLRIVEWPELLGT